MTVTEGQQEHYYLETRHAGSLDAKERLCGC